MYKVHSINSIKLQLIYLFSTALRVRRDKRFDERFVMNLGFSKNGPGYQIISVFLGGKPVRDYVSLHRGHGGGDCRIRNDRKK